MNLSQKCNCCVCESVCKFKDVYQEGVESILNTTINAGEGNRFYRLRDCPHIEVSIKCPHMVTRSQAKGVE